MMERYSPAVMAAQVTQRLREIEHQLAGRTQRP
jgi:hypothetical protein